MSKHTGPAGVDGESNDAALKNRRDFLKSLGKWSTIIISGVALGSMVAPDHAAGWVNGGGGGWVNARGGGGGGGGWVNRSGGGSWINGGRAWVNGGGSWVNRSGGGGGGGSWVNRRGY